MLQVEEDNNFFVTAMFLFAVIFKGGFNMYWIKDLNIVVNERLEL